MSARRILKRAAVTLGAILLLLVALFAVGVLWPERELAPIRTETPIAIRGVSVINANEEIKARQTVLVSQGRIATVGDEDTVVLPENTAVVVGGGRYLLPALWDMHTTFTPSRRCWICRRARSWSIACKILWRFFKNPVAY